ncbi:uncharacterized protein [Panulirus ornatus]|uniref:uncharacterized protein n=1 Tax=Panulirus ornatus TaxID=150431 RepID=UPI003A891884
MDSTSKGTVKKKFNKRAYLKQKLKTNFGSRQEGRGLAFVQKNAIVQRYFRQQRKDEERQRKRNQHLQSMEGEDQIKGLQLHSKSNPLMKTDIVEDESLSSQRSRKKLNSWQRAKGEYRKKVAERARKKQEALKRKEEIEEAKRKYKENRLHRFKKLNQKTKKGQPVMRGRIEIMLEKLQESMT